MRKVKIFILIIFIVITITGCSSLPFTNKNYTLEINKKGEGTITEPNGEGKYEFEEGTIVSIKIDPAENYEFKKWEGKNSSDLLEKAYNREWEITMDENKSIIAVFNKKEYSMIEGQINIYNRMDNSAQSSLVNSSNEEKQSKNNNNLSTSYKENEIIIKYKSTVSIQSAKSIEKNNSLSKMSQMKNRRDIALYKIPKDKTVPQMVDKFKKQENVEWVEPNYIYKAMEVPNDPYYDKQWGHIQMNLESAWDKGKGSNSVTVAVVDTGIIPEHPDLEDNLLTGADFVGGANEEPVNDYNRTDSDPTDETSKDLGGSHGTHVAGIIGAVTDNKNGVAGVNWNIDILPVRVMGSNGLGSLWDIAEGCYYAVDKGADVINLSLGRDGSEDNDPSDLEKDVLEYANQKGVVVFAASGNGGKDGIADSPINYPAQYDSTIAVGAIGSNYQVIDYSNYGTNLDLVAPGGDSTNMILSTWGYYNSGDPVSSYSYMSGTSMATPYASGVAALLIANGVRGVENIKERMTSTAVDLGTEGKDDYFGYGLIDAYGALLNEKIGGPYIFAVKESDGKIEVVSEVIQFSKGDYQLNNVEPGEVKVYGWRDSNNNNIVDAGDYWGESNSINTVANNSYTLDFDIYYVKERTASNLKIKEMGEL